MGFYWSLRNQLPVKQGLRQVKIITFVEVYDPQKPTSSKTRIKTMAHKDWLTQRDMLRNQLPVKQGLRLTLKHQVEYNAVILRNQLPVKQGLRHWPLSLVPFCVKGLRNQLPVKQGLRLTKGLTKRKQCTAQKPTSSKTRIKTSPPLAVE